MLTAAIFPKPYDSGRAATVPPEPEPGSSGSTGGLPADGFSDAVDVAAEGQAIERDGVQYLVDGLVPNYGVLGMSVAFAKVGKTTFAQCLAGAVGNGAPFLGRATQQVRVLILAAEDPPEYTAWLARHMAVPPNVVTFYRRPITFNADGLAAITQTVLEGHYGLVLCSSWQSVVSGLVRDENDNAGAVAVVERVKIATRVTRIPWLIDAHSGKGEDQSDGADPVRALRGASGAAGSADFLWSLRYDDSAFGSRRRLTGKGRFVSFDPMVLDYDLSTGTFTMLQEGRHTSGEETWQRIQESGILTAWSSTDDIAKAINCVRADGKVTGTGRRRVNDALKGRPVDTQIQTRRGQPTTLYRQSEVAC